MPDDSYEFLGPEQGGAIPPPVPPPPPPGPGDAPPAPHPPGGAKSEPNNDEPEPEGDSGAGTVLSTDGQQKFQVEKADKKSKKSGSPKEPLLKKGKGTSEIDEPTPSVSGLRIQMMITGATVLASIGLILMVLVTNLL